MAVGRGWHVFSALWWLNNHTFNHQTSVTSVHVERTCMYLLNTQTNVRYIGDFPTKKLTIVNSKKQNKTTTTTTKPKQKTTTTKQTLKYNEQSHTLIIPV